MTLPTHRMSLGMFSAIARGQGGVAAVEALGRAQESKVKVLLREILEGAAGPSGPFVERAYETLAVLSRDHAATVREILRHPVVGAWAVEAAGAPRPAGPARMAYVAAAAAIRSGTRRELTLPAPVTREPIVPLPTLGHVVLPVAGEPIELRTGEDGAEVTCGPVAVAVGGDDPRWVPFRGITAEADGVRLHVQLDRTTWLLAPDLIARGKHRIDDATPDDAEWAGHLTRAWQVLTGRHHGVALEAAAAYSVLTPLARPDRGQNSGTYEDAYGCLAMSPPPSGVAGAAVIAHELRHAQLAVLMDLFALVEPDEQGTYYAPWRPDPRPVRGLLHGVYAHLGLSAFWAAEARVDGPGSEAEVHLARWRHAASEGARTLLEQARLTPIGRRFVELIRDELDRLGRMPVSPSAADLARRQAEVHRSAWISANAPAGDRTRRDR